MGYHRPREVKVSSWTPTSALLRGYYRRLGGYGALMAIFPLLVLWAQPILGVAAAVVCWPQALLLAGMAWTPSTPGLGGTVVVSEAEGGPLLQVVREVAAAVGGPAPDEVRLASDGRVRLVPVGGGPWRKARWAVVLGAGSLAWLSQDELRATLAREQVRYFGDDPDQEAWLVSMLCTIDETWWYRPWLLFGVMHEYGREVRRERKARRMARLVDGDAAAERLVGRVASDSAIVRRAEAEQLVAWHLAREGSYSAAGLRAWAARPQIAHELAADRAASLDRGESGWPTLASRLADAALWRDGRSPETGPAAALLIPGLDRLAGELIAADISPTTGVRS